MDTYRNITLKGVPLADVLAFVTTWRQSVFVTPTMPDGFTVIYPEANADWLAARLFRHFACSALLTEVEDEVMLRLTLFEAGEIADIYDSSQDPPTGGDATRLCEAFKLPISVVADLEPLLRAPQYDEDYGYAFATERVQEIVGISGLPEAIVGAGFVSVDRGHAPEGFASVADLTVCRPDKPLPFYLLVLTAPQTGIDLETLWEELTDAQSDIELAPFGTPSQIRKAIVAHFPKIDAHIPSWLVDDGDGYTLDFPLGIGESPLLYVPVYVTAETKELYEVAYARLLSLGNANGWWLIDPEF